MSGRIASASLKDKIVLVGTTAPGLHDLRVTPVGEVYPGVETHANVIAGMLDGKVVAQRPLVAINAIEQAGFFKRLWHELLMWWYAD